MIGNLYIVAKKCTCHYLFLTGLNIGCYLHSEIVYYAN